MSQKPSARGKYVSVKIGPVTVKSWEQVLPTSSLCNDAN